jgi:hypothetical protein
MSRLTSLTDARQHSRLDRVLLTSAVALTLIALPVGMSADGPSLDWQAAVAKDNGKGNGGGNGKGHGKNDRGQGHRGGLDDESYRHGRGHGAQGGVSGPHDVEEFVDSVRSGRAFGLERRDERVSTAKERYREALGKPGRNLGQAQEARPAAYGFSPEETTSLIERGWKGPAARSAGFRNHGERTRTMVELAKQLGYGAHVGALQANFGTPFENGLAELQAELAAAEQAGNAAEAERLRAELATAIQEAKPGAGPDDGWATADLDVNDDQVVDRRDLEALAPREEQQAGQGS